MLFVVRAKFFSAVIIPFILYLQVIAYLCRAFTRIRIYISHMYISIRSPEMALWFCHGFWYNHDAKPRVARMRILRLDTCTCAFNIRNPQQQHTRDRGPRMVVTYFLFRRSIIATGLLL